MKITHEILRKKGFTSSEYGYWYLEVSPDFDVQLCEGIDNSFYPSLHQAPEMSHQEEQVVALPFIETVQQLNNLLSVVGVKQGIDLEAMNKKAEEIIENIPKTIYLQIGDKLTTKEVSQLDFNDLVGVSWCGERINKTDIEYSLNLERSEQLNLSQLWKMAQKYNCDDFIKMVGEVEG